MNEPTSIRTARRPGRRARTLLGLTLPALLLLSACGGGTGGGAGAAACGAPAGTPPELVAGGSNGHIAIVNDDATLAGLVTCRQDVVPVDAAAAAKPAGPALGKAGWEPTGKLTLTLVSEVAPPTVVGAPRFTGTGPDDLANGGAYTGADTRAYVVEIDAAGDPDTFRWSDDGGATWGASAVPVTGATQALSRGVLVAFGTTTGHAAGDLWRFDAGRLQATSVSMNGDHAVVSYAVAGDAHLGGILVFQKFTKDPVLRSEALFLDTDVHAVDVSNGMVYGAGASEPGSFPDPAVLDRLKLNGSRLELTGYTRLGLPSFAATAVTRVGQDVYATSGSTGGLTVVDDAAFAPVLYLPLDDARWVDVEQKTVAVVQGGAAGGTLTVLDGAKDTLPTLGAFPFAGADVAEAKTTVQMVGGKAYIAAGSAGVQVLSVATGKVLAQIPAPTDTGLDPADVVANAVAVEDHLIFISFGGAGVYVAETEKPCTEPDDGAALNLKVLGRLRFGDFQSTNHVAVLDGHLFVASGLGGLKIVRVDYHH